MTGFVCNCPYMSAGYGWIGALGHFVPLVELHVE